MRARRSLPYSYCLASFLGLSLRYGCLGVGLDGSFALGRHLVLRGKGLAVDLARLEQLVMVADLRDTATLHDDDAIGVLHGADALGDDELGRVGQIACQPCADLGVGLGVDSAGGVVQD